MENSATNLRERMPTLNRHVGVSNTNQNQKLFIRLVEALVASKISGRPAAIADYQISEDGRKRKRIVRELVEEGSIKVQWDRGGGATEYFLVNDVVLEQYEQDHHLQKPDLIGRLKDDSYHLGDIRKHGRTSNSYQEHGVCFSSLPLEQQVYVVKNPDEFGFLYHRFGKAEEFEFGKVEELEDKLGRFPAGTLCIFTDEFVEFVEDSKFEGRVLRSFNANINWGLNTLCNVSEEVAEEAFSSVGYKRFPSSGEKELRQVDSSARLNSKSAQALSLIAEATAQFDAINRVEKAVAMYGGWDKFNSDLKEKITQALKDEDNDEGVQADV